MQVYDIIILIIVGWLTLRGTMKGMVSQVASLAAVILSFWSAVRFGPVLEPIMRSSINAQPPWDKVLAITVAFVGASIAVMLVQRVLSKIISAIRLKKFDHLCGALFGFLKGVLIGMIITFFAVMLSEQTREMATTSHSGKILVQLIQRTQNLLPDDVSALINSNLEGFQQQINSGKDAVEKFQEASKAGSEAKNAFEKLQDTFSNLIPKSANGTDVADIPPSLATETEKDAKSGWPFSLLSKRPTTYAEESGTTDTTSTSSSTNGPQLLASLINDELSARNSDQIRAARNAIDEPIPIERFNDGYLSPSQLGVNSLSTGTSTIPTTARETRPPAYTSVGDRTTTTMSTPTNGLVRNNSSGLPSGGVDGDALVAPSASRIPIIGTISDSTTGSTSTVDNVTDWRTLMRNMR